MNTYQRLKDMREDNDLEQADVAKLLQSTQQQISKYETGRQKMGIDKYIVLAKHYNVSLDYLAGIIDIPRPLFESNIQSPQVLTEKQKKILQAYAENRSIQSVIDKILDIK